MDGVINKGPGTNLSINAHVEIPAKLYPGPRFSFTVREARKKQREKISGSRQRLFDLTAPI